MTDETFKREIYSPYLEAWKILRLIQYAQHRGTDEMWDVFFKEVDRLAHTYPDNRYIKQLIHMMLEAADYIVDENSKTE